MGKCEFFNAWVCISLGFVMCVSVCMCEFRNVWLCVSFNVRVFFNICTCIYCVFVLIPLCIFILFMFLFNFVSYIFLI